MTADAAIVTEPTELELIVAHKGFVWIEIEVEGRAAHGSRYEEGVDAIVKAGPVLTGIGELDAALGARTHPLLGRGSVHASLIERRRRDVELPRRAARSGSSGGRCPARRPSRSRPRSSGSSREAPPAAPPSCVSRSPWTRTARSCARSRQRPADARLAGAPYWADAAFIAAAGIPTVMYGASGTGAHAVEEWVSVKDTIAVTETLIEVAARICRK